MSRIAKEFVVLTREMGHLRNCSFDLSCSRAHGCIVPFILEVCERLASVCIGKGRRRTRDAHTGVCEKVCRILCTRRGIPQHNPMRPLNLSKVGRAVTKDGICPPQVETQRGWCECRLRRGGWHVVPIRERVATLFVRRCVGVDGLPGVLKMVRIDDVSLKMNHGIVWYVVIADSHETLCVIAAHESTTSSIANGITTGSNLCCVIQTTVGTIFCPPASISTFGFVHKSHLHLTVPVISKCLLGRQLHRNVVVRADHCAA